MFLHAFVYQELLNQLASLILSRHSLVPAMHACTMQQPPDWLLNPIHSAAPTPTLAPCVMLQPKQPSQNMNLILSHTRLELLNSFPVPQSLTWFVRPSHHPHRQPLVPFTALLHLSHSLPFSLQQAVWTCCSLCLDPLPFFPQPSSFLCTPRIVT